MKPTAVTEGRFFLLQLIVILAVILVCDLSLSPAHATTAAATPSNKFTLYVTNETSGDLTVIDGASKEVLSTVPLGKRPRGIKADPKGGRLFVALSGSPRTPPWVDESEVPPPDKSADGIGIVDLKTGEVERIIRGVSDPEQMAVSADGKRLYIASEDTGTAVVTDIASGKVLATLEVGGEPEGVTISPDGRFVYVTSEEDHQVSVIDTKTNSLHKQFPVGKRPRSSAFSPDGRRAYVTGENDGTVSIVDTKNHEVIQTLQLPGDNPRPMGVVVSPNGKRLYVATGRGATLVAYDTDDYQVLGVAEVGPRPWGLAISPDGSELYSADGPSNQISVVNAKTMELKEQIEVGERPLGSHHAGTLKQLVLRKKLLGKTGFFEDDSRVAGEAL